MATLIYPPTLDWEFMTQRPQQLMRQFAKNGHVVYYCNEHCRPLPPQEIEPNLFVVYDTNHFLKEVRPTLQDETILWVTRADTVHNMDRYGVDVVVYDCCDHFEEWLEPEKKILRKADLVIASSEWLYQRMLREHPFVFKIPNACDFDHFNKVRSEILPVPDEMKTIPKPVIGYSGAIASWVDTDRINRLARFKPKYSIVLVGALIGGEKGLARYPNLHILGEKPYDVLPNYLSCFDVALIPFKQNYTTIAANPIKFYEYLATGKPVVTTALPEIFLTDIHVTISFNRSDIPKKVDEALKRKDESLVQHRLRIAAHNTWEQRYHQIKEALSQHIKI